MCLIPWPHADPPLLFSNCARLDIRISFFQWVRKNQTRLTLWRISKSIWASRLNMWIWYQAPSAASRRRTSCLQVTNCGIYCLQSNLLCMFSSFFLKASGFFCSLGKQLTISPINLVWCLISGTLHSLQFHECHSCSSNQTVILVDILE